MKAERPHTQVTAYRIRATLSERVHVPSNNKNLSGRGTARWEWGVIAEFKEPQIVSNLKIDCEAQKVRLVVGNDPLGRATHRQPGSIRQPEGNTCYHPPELLDYKIRSQPGYSLTLCRQPPTDGRKQPNALVINALASRSQAQFTPESSYDHQAAADQAE